MSQTSAYVALDVGERRIGVATAEVPPGIAVPYGIVMVGEDEITAIATIINKYRAERVIVGYPRNQAGEATAQSAISEACARRLQQRGFTVVFQDESLTSVLAEQRLAQRAKPYTKGDIDAEAATIILQDYLEQNR